MKFCSYTLLILLMFAAPAFATVTVTQPSNGQTLGSPVKFVATATTSCSKGIASMGVYVNNSLKYVHTGKSLNAAVSLPAGAYRTVVQAWDNCGNSTISTRNIKVASSDGVHLTSPSNNSTVGPTVAFTGTATAPSCPQGVSAMGVYVDNVLKYKVAGAKLGTQLALPAGAHTTVAQAWDHCGHSSTATAHITVSGTSTQKGFNNLQAIGGWIEWGEMGPKFGVCKSPCSGVTVSMQQHVRSPSKSGNATKFNISGKKPYSDALFSVAPLGQRSSTGVPDTAHKILPTIHNFIYDADVYVPNPAATQSLEFDANMYLNSKGMQWGTQCAHLGDGDWDVWDNVNAHWRSTGVACPLTAGWHHVTFQVERESNDDLLYKTITWDGVTHTVNKTYPPFKVPASWYGVTLNYQVDGNYKMASNSTYLDNLSIKYW